MKRITQISTLIALTLWIAIANLSAQELSKSYQESYDVNANATVQIENKYGQVHISTWDKNQVSIDVEVRVEAKNEEESQEILDKINVKITGDKDHVKASTIFDGKLKCDKCDMSIVYKVKMPASNVLNLKNEFGNAYVDDRSGTTEVRVDYGNLELGELTGKNNTITVKFGNADIDVLTAGKLNIEYSNLELAKADYLDLYSRFNGLELGEVSELILDSQYDGIEISSGEKMQIKASFSDIEIGSVSKMLELTSSYGGVDVKNVDSGFSSVDINSEFGGVNLGVSSSASYKLKASSSFGDIVFPKSKANVTKEVEKNFEKEVEAFIGNDKSSSSTMVISVKNAGADIH